MIAPYNIQFKSNIFQEYAHGSAGISVRYNSMEALDQIEQRIKKIITSQKRNKIYQVHFESGQKRPAMEQSPEITDFYKKIKQIATKIDVRVLAHHRWSSSDICHIHKNMPKIDGIGPIGEFLPTNNERIIRHSVIERSLLLAMVLINK